MRGSAYQAPVVRFTDHRSDLEACPVRAFTAPIVTTLEPLETFYRGEDYHQNFASHNPNQGYIVHVARPKVEKLIHAFPDLLKGDTQ